MIRKAKKYDIRQYCYCEKKRWLCFEIPYFTSIGNISLKNE